MTNEKFSELFGQSVRNPEKDLLTQFHMDIASSIQSVIEEIVLKLVKSISKEHYSKNLCMAGGVALNCVANGKILTEKIFENLWIQPAAGDAGGALGAALGGAKGGGFRVIYLSVADMSLSAGSCRCRPSARSARLGRSSGRSSLAASRARRATILTSGSAR